MPKSTIPKRTWKYTKEFKLQAVKLSFRHGFKVNQVAQMLDIHPFMLSRWRKEYREGTLQGDGQKRKGEGMAKRKLSSREMTEFARLKKENAQLKKENDLLKKWQRFLAEQHQNAIDSSKDSQKS